MIPVENQPTEYLEAVFGRVEKVQCLNGVLAIKLRLIEATHDQESDIYRFDTANKYVRQVLFQQLGSLVYNNRMLEFERLVDCGLIISFAHINGMYKKHVNLVSIVVTDLLIPFAYEEEENSDGR